METAHNDTGEPRKFYADANVGVFQSVYQPPIMPDVFVSLDVEFQKDWLRWTDATDGQLILTGSARALQEAKRAERLAEKLCELGVDPQEI